MVTRRRHDRPSGATSLGAALLAAALLLEGCYAWTPVRQEALRDGSVEIRTRRARFTAPDQSIELVVHRVDRARVEGREVSSGVERAVDLTRPWRIEAHQPDREATAVVILASTVLGAATIVGGLFLVFAATFDPRF
ncbi:MAG: hypothetical protein U0326_05555 [Polyangiales bacterium]